LRIIDGDGHVLEGGGGAEDVKAFLPEPYRSARVRAVFPEIDHLHNEPVQLPPDAGVTKKVGPDEWAQFLVDVGIEASVLYPSAGLAVGSITSRDWAIAATRAYNDWLHATYVSTNPALHGMALLPMQDPEAAVEELCRSVTQLGMKGAMLPANGLRSPLGSKEFWPVYAEAQRLGCALAVHGGTASRLGFDHIEVRPAAHSLAHPFGILISMTSLVFNGVFSRFPGLRVGFLEGGVAWLLLAWERFDRSYQTHIPYNPRHDILELDRGETVAGYLASLADEGRLVIGCEGEEPDLTRAIELLGSGAFMFSSDFPHEVSAQMCKEELGEIMEHGNLTSAQKADVLGGTAMRFYDLT
jgi:predicted TIM-barrel fold metal-dependent hydrolase